MTTDKMKRAVQFCEQWCIKFNGDINNYKEVSNFLGKYLKVAKEQAEMATEAYNNWAIEHGYD